MTFRLFAVHGRPFAVTCEVVMAVHAAAMAFHRLFRGMISNMSSRRPCKLVKIFICSVVGCFQPSMSMEPDHADM